MATSTFLEFVATSAAALSSSAKPKSMSCFSIAGSWHNTELSVRSFAHAPCASLHRDLHALWCTWWPRGASWRAQNETSRHRLRANEAPLTTTVLSKIHFGTVHTEVSTEQFRDSLAPSATVTKNAGECGVHSTNWPQRPSPCSSDASRLVCCRAIISGLKSAVALLSLAWYLLWTREPCKRTDSISRPCPVQIKVKTLTGQ